ncbi:hypothetical protein ACEPAH_4257 [Sanghuangporus vaninii]
MSLPEVNTPSSTTGSTAGSPPPSQPPVTPLSPNSAGLPTPVDGDNKISNTTTANNNATSTGKRKPNRRANTAERRATHNAVERARRETLNGRFLDLAALLPNLATVRRPSKSAIVNSSIAMIHQSRRTRLLAARELRLIRAESDALRRELNEWRARAGLPRVEEPPRSPEFLNLISPQDIEGAGGVGGWDGERLGEMGEEERRAYELALQGSEDDGMDDGDDDFVRMNPAFKAPAPAPVASQSAGQINQLGIQQQLGFSRNLAFDSMPSHPALSAGVNTMYEPNGLPHGASHALPVHPDFAVHAQQISHDKLANWVAQGQNQNQIGIFLGQQSQQQHWAQQFAATGAGSFTPPVSAGGPNSPMGGNPFFLQQQQQASQQQIYPSPELDDASSVGSADGIGNQGSVGGSPVPFDVGGNTGAAYGRKPSLSISLPSAPYATPISVGGGGGRHVAALMF